MIVIKFHEISHKYWFANPFLCFQNIRLESHYIHWFYASNSTMGALNSLKFAISLKRWGGLKMWQFDRAWMSTKSSRLLWS